MITLILWLKFYLVHPETIVFGADLCCNAVFLFIYLFQHEISEIYRPVIRLRLSFIMSVQNFGGPLPKNFRGQRHAKFGLLLDDFKLYY